MKTVKHEKLLKIVYALIDISIICMVILFAYIVRYGFSFPKHLLDQYIPIFMLGGIITLFSLHYYKLHSTNREWTYGEEIYRVFKSLGFSFLPTAGAIFFFKAKIVSRLVFVNAWIFMLVSLSLWRILKRAYVRRLIRKGFQNFNLLIIGTGRTSSVLINEIQQNPFLGFNIIGFLDDDLPTGTDYCGYSVIGTINDLIKITQKHFIDTVFLTVPHSREMIHKLMSTSQKLGISFRVVPDYYDFIIGDIRVHHLGFVPTLEYNARTIHGTDLIFKRSFDIFFSLLALIALAPLLLIISTAIKSGSPGRIFYVSKRCGKKGTVFNFYKFRTMTENADKKQTKIREQNEKDGPIFKIKNDPRVTRVGRFLRKYSLDELPQLWNVLKGDMSLVGPRPPIPEEVKEYDFWHMQRLSIRPGITCLWQTRGRSNLSFRRWMKLDMFYIENWSFWLDIKILMKTIVVVIKGEGAY